MLTDWQSLDFSDQNIFEMCVANGGPGFWIRRTTWGATCARVVGIGQFTKPAPYYGSPPVVMDVYSLKGEVKEGLAKVSAAGTYKTWRKIEAPEWAEATEMRSLSDPSIELAVQGFDRRQPASTEVGPMVFLSVPFARRDEAKRIGARWSPSEKRWWLAPTNEEALTKARALGFL